MYLKWHANHSVTPLDAIRYKKISNEELCRIVTAGHWFFCRIEGRRRIGKTTLLGHLARSSDNLSSQLN